ncbi:MAG TPA: ATP-binding protein [Methanocorpusculum sp.]|nr:ATP-binding protein [Methanocorpusculum sp.]
MIINRDHYVNALIQRKHNGSIKVVTGLRRCGKSFLLFTLFKNHLKQSGIAEDHIIEIVLDDLENEDLCEPHALLSYIKSCITDTDMYYILLDEVQEVPRFEALLNSLLHLQNADIYVTGSNSKFLSRDIITGFRGRGDEVHLYPLTFREFMSVYQGTEQKGWDEYITYGGLPPVILRETHEQKAKYLTDLFTETYLKDIIARNHIKNTAQLETLIDVLSSSMGSLTNPQRICNTFASVEKTTVSAVTIKSYLDALEYAFLIISSRRFDVRGRKYIGSPLKYYFEDTGLRNARLHFRQQEDTYLMENVIFNELRVRGYHVDVGVVELRETQDNGVRARKQLEIDFVANQGSKKYYVQSAFSMPTAEKTAQEKKSLLNAGDNFKKIIVVKDAIMPRRDNDGITTMSIFDFLLNENSLEL